MAFFEILHVTNLTHYILLMPTVRFGLQISMKEEDLCGGDETLLLATKKGKKRNCNAALLSSQFISLASSVFCTICCRALFR